MAYDVRMDNIEHLDFEPGDPDEELPPNADEAPQGPGNSPEQQESNVPRAWKPTPAEPVPVIRCTQIKKDGTRCKRWSLRGYHKCKPHAGPGAMMPDGNVNKYREAVMEAARLRLLDLVDPALDGLYDLTQPGTGEAIRLKAYTEILDRAGIRGGFEVDVAGEVTVSPAIEISKRLEELKKGAEEVTRMREELHPTADVVDGEVIDDSEQPSLFDLPDESEDEA